MKHTLFITAGALVMLASCATQSTQEATGKAVSQTRAGLADAAMTPLEDLNLRREEIPPVLTEIKNPYDVQAEMSCEEIAASVAELNAVLGPDFDAVKEEDDSTLSDKAGDAASDGILNVVASEAGGLIPYRGWVRQLSGAKRHEAKVKRAINKGTHRRTYLKAVGAMKGCEGIASPNFEAMSEQQKVVFRGHAPEGYEPQPAPETEYQTASGPPAEPVEDPGLAPADIDSDPLGDVDGYTKADRKAKAASGPTSYPPIED